MKTRIYLRVGYDKKRRKYHTTANVKPSTTPLGNNRGEYFPTVSFALDLEIPDALFSQAERVIATLTIPEEAAEIAADVSPRDA